MLCQSMEVSNEGRAEEARVRRENQVKQTNDDADDDEGVIAKRQSRSPEKVEACEDIGHFIWI